MRSLCPLLALLAVALSGCEPTGPAPYGFGEEPVQPFVFESEERTEIGAAPVEVVRYAEVELRAEEGRSGVYELAVLLGRYYMRVEGAPGGDVELAVSPEGLVTRSPSTGELRLGADDPGPGGRSMRSLLAAPIGGILIDPEGRIAGDPWQSQDPTLGDLPLVEWLALALPELSGGGAASWSGRRRVPPLGQYRLGLELPVRYERVDGGTIRSAGNAQRSSIELAPGYRGRLEIDQTMEASLSPDGHLDEARIELVSAFEDEGGERIHARYRVRVRSGSINPPVPGTDTP